MGCTFLCRPRPFVKNPIILLEVSTVSLVLSYLKILLWLRRAEVCQMQCGEHSGHKLLCEVWNAALG
ncbi:MAG TPA: hypothetical protein VKV29_10565, partial [Chthonomonas sp.]|uniref:hypothetical protein n=1 Tax=Chthonomonas sp. TaxID=2282153 RepID=UPI002B4B13F2